MASYVQLKAGTDQELSMVAATEIALVERGEGRKGDQRRAQLVAAKAAMLSKGRVPATMSELADAAGMSTATAYRYFPSIADVDQAYVADVMGELYLFSSKRKENGVALLRVISRFWIELVVKHGLVLVEIRSRKGFFERLQSRVTSTVRGYEARQRAFEEVLAELGLPLDLKDDAAMLYNTLFDTRDILDLIRLRRMDPDRVSDALVACFIGAVKGWHMQSLERSEG